MTPRFVRFQAATPNARGHRPGVFGLVNGLRRGGSLGPAEVAWVAQGNAWFDAAYRDPSTVAPGAYRDHPAAAAWFKTTATHLVERVDPYLHLLDAHGIGWERVESDAPGRIVYEDDVQVVVWPSVGTQ